MENFTQLKSFADACKVEGLDAEKVIPDLSVLPAKDRESVIAYLKLIIIARAANRLANEGKEWLPDWNNHKEWKHQPWFEMGGSSGFRFYDFGYWRSVSGVGSRLCFVTGEVGKYVATQFTDLYKQFMTI